MAIDFTNEEILSDTWVEYRLIGTCKCGASRAAYRESEETRRIINRDYTQVAQELLRVCKPSLFRPTRPRVPDFYPAQFDLPYRGIFDDDSTPNSAPKNDEFTSVRKYVDYSSVRDYADSDIYAMSEIERRYSEATRWLAGKMAEYIVDTVNPAIKQPAPPVKIPQKEEPRKISWEV